VVTNHRTERLVLKFNIDKKRGVYPIIDRLFESPWVFNANQILLDGGKGRQIERFLRDLPFKSMVDIGCGPGNWARLARGPYTGIDTSESFIRACRQRYDGDVEKQFIHADATSLSLESTCDLAIMISVLHHLSDREALKIVDWASKSAEYFFVLDLYPNDRNPASAFLYAMDRGNHIRPPEEQKELLLSTGAFSLEQESDYYSPTWLYRHTMFLLKRTASEP